MSDFIYNNPAEQIIAILSELLDVQADQIIESNDRKNCDLVIHYKDIEFQIELKKYASSIEITNGINQLNRNKLINKELSQYKIELLLVVPFMGEVGAKLCKKNGISWVDLSGNAFIKADGIYVNVSGKENQFKHRGRPLQIFAPKSSRVARYILTHNELNILQKDIVGKTGLTEGYVSRILKRLEKENLIKKSGRGQIEIKDKELILNAWLENYDFMRNKIIKGIVPANSKSEAINKIITHAIEHKINYAITGLSGAWLFNSHVDYRITSIYVENDIKKYLETEGFLETERGANVWMVIPQDEGVFQEIQLKNNIQCVHPVQLYLDLMKGHPERAKDAAEEIKKEILIWRNNNGL